jgi:G3E family GTPase
MATDTIPVTVLTGYLGAGKTTLLNHLLTANHGRRIAVIENEFGEIGIDHALVIRAEEEVFEMSNGCICCTVRGDLLRILGNLQKRRDRFDHILIETTGMADPGPVAQTFFTDPDTRDRYRLDGVVTVVDAKHLLLHLDSSDEAQAQIAFADVILLNKTDLISASELDRLEVRIRYMNIMAQIHRTVNAVIDPGPLLDLGGFDLDRAQRIRPNFLEPEYPFEWAGIHALPAGRTTITITPCGDDHVDVAVVNADSGDFCMAADFAARAFAEPAIPIAAGESFVPGCGRVRLALVGDQPHAISLTVPWAGRWLVATEHGSNELHLRVVASGTEVVPEEARELGGHVHESAVTSVGIEEHERDIDQRAFHTWINQLLQERGSDLYRYKGILAMAGEDRQIVLQGVHMLLTAQGGAPWTGPRRSQLVFIGRNLDRAALVAGFHSCLV